MTLQSLQDEKIYLALAAPGATQKSVAHAFGIPPAKVRGAVRRHRKNEIGFDATAEKRAKRKLTNETLITQLETVINRVLDSLDARTIEKANLSQRMIGLGIAIDKRQLLKGEATVIHAIDRRAKVDELMPALLEEAKRRGYVIELPKSEYEVGPDGPVGD